MIGSVERDLIAGCCLIGCFHDIDLAVCRPVRRIGQPESGPKRAADGRMFDVEDEEAVIIGGLGLDTSGDSTSCCIDISVVNTENCGRRPGKGEVQSCVSLLRRVAGRVSHIFMDV